MLLMTPVMMLSIPFVVLVTNLHSSCSIVVVIHSVFCLFGEPVVIPAVCVVHWGSVSCVGVERALQSSPLELLVLCVVRSWVVPILIPTHSFPSLRPTAVLTFLPLPFVYPLFPLLRRYPFSIPLAFVLVMHCALRCCCSIRWCRSLRQSAIIYSVFIVLLRPSPIIPLCCPQEVSVVLR